MRLAGREHPARRLIWPICCARWFPHLCVMLIAAAEARLPNRDDRHRHDVGCRQRRRWLGLLGFGSEDLATLADRLGARPRKRSMYQRSSRWLDPADDEALAGFRRFPWLGRLSQPPQAAAMVAKLFQP
jgi:hypothetical protein